MKKKLTLLMLAALLMCGPSVMTSCGDNDDNEIELAQKKYLKSWNKCEALTALQEYVEDVTNPKSADYISEEDRIATFDMDGRAIPDVLRVQPAGVSRAGRS